MATKSVNNIYKSIAPKSLCDDMSGILDATVSFNQGDLIALDTTAHLAKAVAADLDSQTLLGVARATVVNGKLKSPYQGTAVDAAEAITSIPGPLFGVEVMLKLNTGDAINPGDQVYVKPSVDAQTVTVTDSGANSDPIGVYMGPAIASAAAGQLIPVMLGARYPGNTLKF